MQALKLLFLINGSEESAAAIRAKRFAQQFPAEWIIHFNYRPSSKWKGILPFLRSALKFQPQVIYVMDTAYTGVLAGYLAKKLSGCKLIVDTGDVAFELAKSQGIYSKPQLSLIHWVEQLAIRNSDCLVVRGSYHKHWLAQQGVLNVEFIPDGVSMSEVKPVDTTALKKQLGLEHHLIVGLVGTMSWSERHQLCYGWDVVEALALLQDLPIKGLLVGDGEGRTILENRAQELGIRDRIVFAGQLPYDELSTYLSAMDICISTQSNDLVGMVRTTGKLPLYLAHSKYVIATDVGEASRVLPGVGYLLPYQGIRDHQHPPRLAAHLKEVLANSSLLNQAQKAKQVAQQHFDYPLLAQRVEQLCRKLATPTEHKPINKSGII
jgi:glycosyltransferase involved in cell wall biosynthesis